jgi:hypothetical protein
MLATGSLVATATAVRVSRRAVGTVATQAPPLIGVALRATAGEPAAQGAFRDELIGLVRETADVSWRELRRGLERFDERTRPDAPRAAMPRPYRVKA